MVEGGGFVPVEYNLTAIPAFSLYGDGRVIVPGPVIMIYPGPAMPNLQTAIIPEDAIQAILSAAREAGLFDPNFDYGHPGISDMPTTTFVVNESGTSYRTEVYAWAWNLEPAGSAWNSSKPARHLATCGAS